MGARKRLKAEQLKEAKSKIAIAKIEQLSDFSEKNEISCRYR